MSLVVEKILRQPVMSVVQKAIIPRQKSRQPNNKALMGIAGRVSSSAEKVTSKSKPAKKYKCQNCS